MKGLQKINWAAPALPETGTDIVHFCDPYQQAWLDACGPTEAFALELLLTYGWRFGELLFRGEAYLPDPPNGPSVVIKMRKNKPMLAPLRPVDARRFAARGPTDRLDLSAQITPLCLQGAVMRRQPRQRCAGLFHALDQVRRYGNGWIGTVDNWQKVNCEA